MVKIAPFEVELWLNKYIPLSKHFVSSSCPLPITLNELRSLSDKPVSPDHDPIPESLFSAALHYGTPGGLPKLRETIATLYSIKTPTPLPAKNVLITPGATPANFEILHALCGKGDHIIVHYPTYQQLYSIPEALGAEVSLWRSKEEDKWAVDVEELKGMIKPNTKAIIINNPQNPTGAILTRSTLESIIEIARENGITVFSDEVYRPLFHSISPADPEFPPSVLSLGYDNVVVSGSMSKAYSLPGIRVGWIASRSDEIIHRCVNWHSYTAISVSQLDESAAAFALDSSVLHNLIKRNNDLARRNLSILESFIEKYRWACEWAKPVASTVAFVKFSKMGKSVDDVAFCELLLAAKGVMFAPGSKCFGNGVDFKGYVRVGYVIETEKLEEVLRLVGEYLEEGFESVPVAKK
ncbi:hypothetical protein AJ80_06136 [Polytolypa hystricis UAMH7299]|uniref:Aminotransferase class I/classII large domain-containing protein n=1 Tax=Polytolypa hystricis (strain UAMH7299) TaxID=1447883 RepID=A0A2B7XZG8_POLH7|nr:hypothetical protein AJ80_06136 [Polytolypa hystricis UAMH7299]